LHDLLTERGGASQVQTMTSGGMCGFSIGETENHQYMTESSRYLTNQLFARELGWQTPYNLDNVINGLPDVILKMLQAPLKQDFSEFNARPYQAFSVMAIENLYDFADDGNVRTGAQLVLDYLSAKFAVSSNGLRRAAPFRRLQKNWDGTDFFDADH